MMGACTHLSSPHLSLTGFCRSSHYTGRVQVMLPGVELRQLDTLANLERICTLGSYSGQRSYGKFSHQLHKLIMLLERCCRANGRASRLAFFHGGLPPATQATDRPTCGGTGVHTAEILVPARLPCMRVSDARFF
jgi:hypothetical protein